MVGLPVLIHSMDIQESMAAAAAVLVVRNAWMARPPELRAEPPLNPNQPNQSSAAPNRTNGMLCGMAVLLSFRFPNISAMTSPANPELMWTTVPPAKSSAWNAAFGFSSDIHPSTPQTQCAIGS